MAVQLENYKDGLDRLCDYVFLVLSRLQENERELPLSERRLLATFRKTGNLGPIVAEALLLMGKDLFEDDDQPEIPDGRPRALEHETAMRLQLTVQGRSQKKPSLRLLALKSEEVLGYTVTKSSLARALGRAA